MSRLGCASRSLHSGNAVSATSRLDMSIIENCVTIDMLLDCGRRTKFLCYDLGHVHRAPHISSHLSAESLQARARVTGIHIETGDAGLPNPRLREHTPGAFLLFQP